jgi:hypothetical protein
VQATPGQIRERGGASYVVRALLQHVPSRAAALDSGALLERVTPSRSFAPPAAKS